MKHRILARLIAAALAGVSVAAVAAPQEPASARQGSERSFDIPAQDLAAALEAFGRQSGKAVMFDRDSFTGIRSMRVQGVHRPDAALQLLLGDSGLEVRTANENTFIIERPSPYGSDAPRSGEGVTALDAVMVFGTLEDKTSVGSKFGQTLRETPKSVTIVSRDRIEAQNLTTVANVMKQATGVTVRDYGPSGGWYFSRGYRVLTTQVDGGAPITEGFGNISSPDTAVFESIEVLRGVDGLFSGAGDPGGVINLVRKRASSTPGMQLNLSAGRWNNHRAELDVTGPLAREGAVRGRAVALYEDRGYYWDRASAEKSLLYGVLETDIGASTVVSLGGSYEHGRYNANDLSGLPFHQDGRSLGLPRSTNLAPDWADKDVVSKEVFAKLEHSFANDALVKVNITHQEQRNESDEMFVRGPVDPVSLIIPGTNITGATATRNERNPTRTAVDAFATGKLGLFSREHVFVVGADYATINNDGVIAYGGDGYPAGNRPPVDVLDFDPALYPAPSSWTLSSLAPVSRQKQHGAYASVRIQLADPLRLMLGARYSHYETRSETFYADANGNLGSQVSYGANYRENALTPNAAFTYEINPDWSAYLSYAETFTPQASLLAPPLPGTPLNAITGDGYELGVKGTLFKGLNTAVAVYRVNRNGQGIRDPAYPFTPGERGANCCYLTTGNVATQGVDIEFSGLVLPGWQMFAGYTYSERVASDAANDNFTGTALYFNWTPDHIFKAWTTWNLPGPLSSWTLNGGVQAQSKFSGYTFGAGLGTPRQGGYAIWNASVDYRVNDRWSAALYVENLLDKTYYEAVSTVRSEGLYGVPRNVIFRLRYKY